MKLKDRLLLDEVVAKIIHQWNEIGVYTGTKLDVEEQGMRVELYDFIIHTKDEEMDYVLDELNNLGPAKLFMVVHEIVSAYRHERAEQNIFQKLNFSKIKIGKGFPHIIDLKEKFKICK